MIGASAIESICDEVGIHMPDGWAEYFDLAKAWDSRTDLTAARTDVELAEILFLDAAQLIRASWVGRSTTLIDVGAGVGAPTIPILLAHEMLSATLVEPRRIRMAFLRTASGALGLGARARMLEQRVDPAAPEIEGGPFDLALSRATFAPAEWLRIGAQLAEEVWVLTAGVEPAAPQGLRLERRLAYEVPSSGAPRTTLAYRKDR